MYRIACLRIPRFQIVVHQKNEPALKKLPFVLLDPGPKPADRINLSRAHVFMCSQSAAKKNVFSAMKWTQAKATCSDLIWRQLDPKAYREAQEQILNELIACSPRVSAREPGVFILDAGGLQRLGGEGKLCRDLLRLVSRLGYVNGQVGIANSAFAALVASRLKKRWLIVPPGKDAEFLKPLSVDHVDLDRDTRDLFVDLGIKSMGDFAQLSLDAVSERFGAQAAKAQQLVFGFDQFQPSVPVAERQFSTCVEIGAPIDSLNQTIFLFKALIDQLEKQLKREGFCAEELLICFFNDDDNFDKRSIKLVRPSNNAKFLLEVLRLSIEVRPLQREFTAIKLFVSRFCNQSFEQTKIDSSDSEDMDARQTNLIQKFLTRLGENSLVRPVAYDQYKPELAGIWVPVVELDTGEKSTVCKSSLYERASGLVLKKSANPIPVLVEMINELPVALAYCGRWYHIRKITCAQCLSGLWWERPFRSSYYTALIEPKYEVDAAMLVSLIYEYGQRSWFIEGVFD